MAIYHCSIKIIGRSSGRSAVACAAYRSGTELYDEELQKNNDYTKKSGVVYTEVMLPDNAPEELENREKLWNSVQQIEKTKNAQLAREVEVALPRELSRMEQINLVRNYVYDNFVSRGMAADIAIHDKGDGNPHAHIMLTTRSFKENGQWAAKEKTVYKLDEQGEKIPVIDPETGLQKIGARNRKVWERETVSVTDWNSQQNAELWRANWAKSCNQYLAPENQIDHRSYARQGKEQEPTVHEGYAAREMENRGEVSEICEHNRQVRERNRALAMLKAEYEKIQRAIADLKHRFDQWREEQKQIAERRRAERQQGKTGYAVVDELLQKHKERTTAAEYSPEVKQLTAEYDRLRGKEKTLRADLQTAKEILAAEQEGDIVKSLLSKANRRTLEERYGAKFDASYPAKLASTIKLAQRKEEEVLRRLQEIRPDIDWKKEMEKQQQQQQNRGRNKTGPELY